MALLHSTTKAATALGMGRNRLREEMEKVGIRPIIEGNSIKWAQSDISLAPSLWQKYYALQSLFERHEILTPEPIIKHASFVIDTKELSEYENYLIFYVKGGKLLSQRLTDTPLESIALDLLAHGSVKIAYVGSNDPSKLQLSQLEKDLGAKQ